MKMIKILQISVVAMFVLILSGGMVIVFLFPDKISAYGQFINMILPIFFGSVVPALIGKPLTEAVRNMTSKEEK